MLSKGLKQFRVLRQKRKLGLQNIVLSKTGSGVFSPKRVTNSFFRVTQLKLKSRGPSVASNDLAELNKSHAAFISNNIFWGPWLPILKNLHTSPATLRGLFSPYKLPSILSWTQRRTLNTFAFPSYFISVLNAILASKIQ